MDLSKFKKVDKSMVILLIAITIGLVMIAVIGDKVIVGAEKIQEDEMKIKSAYANREKFDEIISTYQDIVSEGLIDDLEINLPTTENFLDVIEELENISKMAGTQIVTSLGEARLTSDGFEIDQNTIKTFTVNTDLIDFDVLEIEVTVRGNYAQFQQFLHLLYQSQYYINPTSLNITRITGDDFALLDAHMNLQIFVEDVIYTQ